MSSPVLLIKLGGGLITDKTSPGSYRRGRIEALADDLAALARERSGGIVVAHGSGSFGHPVAAGTPLDPSTGSRSSRQDRSDLQAAIGPTQDAAARLHRIVTAAILERHPAVYSLAPSSFLAFRSGASVPQVLTAEPLRLALRLGLVVVSHGDVVLEREGGARIASTEQVLLAIAGELARCDSDGGGGFEIERCLWLGETAGILRPDGATAKSIDGSNLETARTWVSGSHGVDVTGGMRLRLDTAWRMAELGIESLILDGRAPGALWRAAATRPAGGDGAATDAGTRVSWSRPPHSGRDADRAAGSR